MFTVNERASRSTYPAELRSIMNIERAQQSRAWLSSWSALSQEPTPLHSLPDMAARLQVAQISLKDESLRSELGSFKALGAPIALVRLILRLWPERQLDPRALIAGQYRASTESLTVISATDGNHGRALAAAARSVGCQCAIVLHAQVGVEREQAIAAYGATIVRIAGNYDESVAEAARLASANGWHVVSDTSYEGYEDIPRDVMQGYGSIAAELVEQTGAAPDRPAPFTHVMLQGGVGGLAAGLASYLWEFFGEERPTFIVVEPQQADCLYQSALQGKAARATGSVDSLMAGLACGEASPLAWRFLQPGIDAFMTISDDDAVAAMRQLASGSDRDVPVVAGESGVAGLAGLSLLRKDAELSKAAKLDARSRVLIINTEGATAPSVYEALVSESAASVLQRQHAWLQPTTPALGAQLASWRRHLHAFPETGFEERQTSAYVARHLRALGLDVHEGIGGTGVVANLKVGEGRGIIGLRADMDALNITETVPGRAHASTIAGKMHACGHDGHMSILLGAARLLHERQDFNGTVRFIFQPAEEHGRGAKAMMADGLFERFPVDEIYGLHNMPGMPAGGIATRAGGIMASEDNFVIHIKGRGTHAARPHMGIDPIVIASEIVLALQTVVSRSLDPSAQAVISCTEIFTDGIRNAIPSNVIIKGDTRSYDPEVQRILERRMREISEGICRLHGAGCAFEYTHEFAPTVNWPQYVPAVVAAATAVVGAARVDADVQPMMISEDFGAFLQVVPGAFVFLGNGAAGEPGGTPLHNGSYDFNDEILMTGASYFAELVRTRLPA